VRQVVVAISIVANEGIGATLPYDDSRVIIERSMS
jgi:hypothetical protein